MERHGRGRVVVIPCSIDYTNKSICRCKAITMIGNGNILMTKTSLAAEIYAHAIWYYILKVFLKNRPRSLSNHLNPIDLEDGGDYWWRRLGYILTYIFVPSVPIWVINYVKNRRI